MAKKNRKKSSEEIKFEKEFKKLKLSAEHGAHFADEKKEDTHFETEEDFLTRMKAFEKAMENPDKREIRALLGYPNFPAVEDLADDELEAAIELVTVALGNENIVLDVLNPTPEREIYRFLTEELLLHDAGMAGAGGMTMHFIYEEFYPNHLEDIKSDVADILHFLCRGHNAGLPWRIAFEVSLYEEKVCQEEFETFLNDHRRMFKGICFIGVDSIETSIEGTEAYAQVSFRYYMDESSHTPGEFKAEAEFYYELFDDEYLLNRLVIPELGIH
ncbi:MAG TPA: hypothetical protein VJ949_12030 [Cryomorphaceae bacterium]|nr:hypothetical protein [Cryomorphaceae bacterium]